jgi:hypothetical protein
MKLPISPTKCFEYIPLDYNFVNGEVSSEEGFEKFTSEKSLRKESQEDELLEIGLANSNDDSSSDVDATVHDELTFTEIS